MLYFSTKNPLTPGKFPEPDGNRVLEVINFDKRTYCPNPSLYCWGFIKYEKPLSEKEAAAYGLEQERSLDYHLRYMVGEGAMTFRTFATAAELNEWFDEQEWSDSQSPLRRCWLRDVKSGVKIRGIDYMSLKPEERWRDESAQAYPELSMYGEDYRLDLCREDPNPDAEVYEIVFEVGEPQTRYYCVIDGCDSLLEALGLFFRDHPNVSYGMIFETLSM